jgi:hypothetical protein
MNHQNQTRTNGIWGHVRYNQTHCRTFILISIVICNELVYEILCVTKAIKTFFLRKNVTLPHLVVLLAKFRSRLMIGNSSQLPLFLRNYFANPKITKILVYLFHEFCGLYLLGTLALVDIATFSCFNHPISQTLTFRGNRAPSPIASCRCLQWIIVNVIHNFCCTPFLAYGFLPKTYIVR